MIFWSPPPPPSHPLQGSHDPSVYTSRWRVPRPSSHHLQHAREHEQLRGVAIATRPSIIACTRGEPCVVSGKGGEGSAGLASEAKFRLKPPGRSAQINRCSKIDIRFRALLHQAVGRIDVAEVEIFSTLLSIQQHQDLMTSHLTQPKPTPVKCYVYYHRTIDEWAAQFYL